MKLPSLAKLITSLLVSELAGVIGALFTAPAISGWYATLAKPEIAPPNWVFGPVWTFLFALMGVAVFLVWQKHGSHRHAKAALATFLGQLILNVIWSVSFFGLQSPGGAFAEIIVLWIAILATIVAFHRVSKAAAYLMIPYLAWVTFAGYLNYVIWSLNR